MKSQWNDAEAAACKTDLDLRVYTSRLLGRDKSLVLHGGGNTSVKGMLTNIFGEAEDILFVKGSGWDLETIEAPGFTPVRMAHLLRLAKLPAMTDLQMVNEFKAATVDPNAPAPSVEAILHAALPFKFVDHTHADAVVTITNTPDGEARIRALYGERVLIIPYLMPGFILAHYCAEAFARQATSKTEGMVLLGHGIFTWGDSAKASYEKMIEMSDEAERYVQTNCTLPAPLPPAPPQPFGAREQARLRNAISHAAGFPMLVTRTASAHVDRFTRRSDLSALTQQGPATPDHIIRTKRVPMLGLANADVARYVEDYKGYFARNANADEGRGTDDGMPPAVPRPPSTLAMVDPAPRVILSPMHALMLTAGRTLKDCQIASEIYEHTIDIQTNADALGGWVALPQDKLFEVEYWDLEQAKLKRAGKPAAFAGEIALVTGASSGIGKACAQSLLARGATVIGMDVNPNAGIKHGNYMHSACDLTNEAALRDAIEQAAQRFGGLDMLILNAGIFPPSQKLAELDAAQWTRTLNVNLNANALLLREAHALLKLAPRGGRVVMIGSKNVPAPGPGAAAYSASKAALTQLARVAALEWGADGIRVNVIHPNMVFDTGIWDEATLAQRAASYKLSVEEYKTNNVLRTEITSKDVAEMAAEMCGPLFAKTTGAQVPLDGGNDRVI